MKIMAAVDRSNISDTVVDMTVRLSCATNAEILLINVAPREPDAFGRQVVRKVIGDPVPADLRDRRELLDRLAAAVRDAGVDCETLLVRGDPGPTLINEARRAGATLVVMGSHGRGGLFKTLMGSVSETVLADGRIPVLVVPARAVREGTAAP
jgi:nucleotide-binding universal stress UspA family protein